MSAGKFMRPLLRLPFYLFATKKHSRLLLKQNYTSYSAFRRNLLTSLSPHPQLQWSAVRRLGAMSALSPLDPSSFSRPELALLKHASLKLNVDFVQKVLSGEATLSFEVQENVAEILLDVRNQTIQSVQLDDGTALKYTVDSEVADFGSKLTVQLPKTVESGEKFGKTSMGHKEEKDCDCCACPQRIKIKIQYRTSPTASALQWLEPAQTSGKQHPYLFSQCQPIHARSILPCQDTPAVKFTYDAEVTAPAQFTVLMSALRGGAGAGVTAFRQPVPVPSYLIAIAVGVLESRRLGPRSLVWSEAAEVERSAWEFADTEKYLQAAERLCGPYVWGQYDLLVLPPSFPYGGMENPCLTFVTPTLLAGDRSQADVIVHEIMHSWTGNLVTNRNFEHFWLNEGFTVFLERKVGASLIEDAEEAKMSRDFHSILGLQELTETVNDLGLKNPLTKLVVDLNGVNPDDAFSTVPYEKGSLFLRYLEDLSGGPKVFDEFLRAYLSHFQRSSLDTEQFKAFLLNYFKQSGGGGGGGALAGVDWDRWLLTPGMPPAIPQYNTSMTTVINELVAKMDQGSITAQEIRDGAASFTPHQTIHFLQQLVDRLPLSMSKLHSLGEALGFASAQNTEILYRWLRLCIRSKDESQLQHALDFVNRQGRMKYVRPIYRDLYAWEQVRQRAIDNFLKNEQFMMHVSAYTVRKDLHLTEKQAEANV